ncbi:MAG: hypothetical protein KDC34_16295 [Saprospiraceae bacterium]|nr:hypothetical protein [Saprospiraceae bacterium]
MKKGILLFLFCFSSSLFFAQEVSEVQMTLLTKRTATWCPNCGTYGWELFTNILADNSEKAIIIAAHYGGSDLETLTSGLFATNFPGGGQPKFFVNNANQAITPSTIDDARISIQNQVNLFYQQPPQAAFGLSITEEAGTYTVGGLVRFLAELEGDFQLGIYQVEKTVIANQSQQGANAEHKQVLTYPLTGGDLSEPLFSGLVTAGTDFNFSYDLVNPADADNIEIVAILWELDGDGKLQFINGAKKDLIDVETNVGTEEPAEDARYGSVSVMDDLVILENNASQYVQLDLIDIQGRVLYTFYQDELDQGTYQYQLPEVIRQHAGVFIIRAIWNQQFVRTAKLVQP